MGSRVDLTRKFAVLSAACLLLLGLALYDTGRRRIEHRAFERALTTASAVAHVGVEPHLRPADLLEGLEAGQVALFQRAFARSRYAEEISRIKIFGPGGEIRYSDEPELIGRRFPMSPAVRLALAGERSAEFAGLTGAEHDYERGKGRLLEVFVPLSVGPPDAPVRGVVEVYVPYEPIRATIRQDTREQGLVIGGGLVLLWLLLFRLVDRASRALRRQLDTNRHLALHDPVTHLPNRALLFDRLEHAVSVARRAEWSVALLVLDLDRFKEINDTLGHHNGDLAIREVAQRLRSVLRESDTVARLGGDEFAVVLDQVPTRAEAHLVAERIAAALERPAVIGQLEVGLGASIGVALFPHDADDAGLLLQRADVAMYAAKEHRTGVEHYAEEHDHFSADRLALVAQLQSAVEAGELFLCYQAKAELTTGAITGVEALVRWRHPVRGVLPPSVFIPVAEQTGAIEPLTYFVLDQSLRDQRRWADAGHDLQVAVNLAPRMLQVRDFVERVEAMLRQHQVPGHRLVLEITETTLMVDPRRALEVLGRLKAFGVSVSIDDFGTGYSSLAYLQKLTIDELKIDRAFVRDLSDNEGDRTIVRSTVELAKSLGLRVVAEGVEGEAAWQELVAMGCDYAQGFLLHRPAEEADFVAWLRSYRARPTAGAAVGS